MSFYVTLTAEQNDFKGILKTQLVNYIRLRGEWEVGVYMCKMAHEDGIAWVLCSVADYSLVNEIPMQLLAIVDVKNLNNSKPMYVRVNKRTISSINVEFRRNPSKEDLIGKTDIICVLHFRKA